MKDGDDRCRRGSGRCQREVKDGDDRCKRGSGRCQREVKDGDDADVELEDVRGK